MADKTIWRLPVVMARTGLGRSSIYARIGKDFPQPIHLGARAVGWDSDEVMQWIQDRIDASRFSTSYSDE